MITSAQALANIGKQCRPAQPAGRMADGSMRILMINHEFSISGSSTAFFRLAMHLQGQGHELTLFPLRPDNGPIRGRYLRAGIPIVEKAVSTEYDLAIGSTICAAPAMVEVAPLVRTIWFVNEADIALKLLQTYPSWAAAFGVVSAVIFNMPFQHDIFRSFSFGLDQAKFHAIPFGVEIEPNMLQRERVPAKTRALRVVQVGTMEPRKRPGDLIEAVSRSRLDIECVICGTYYDLRDDARAAVERNPAHFRLLSGLSDGEVLAWVESADMFCLASESETQAIAVYEAALLARPLLLTDLPCYRDVFMHGRNCLMYPARHIEMLAGSMRMLAGSPALRAELGQAAQRTARRFTNRRFYGRFDDVVSSVLEAA